MHKYKIQTYIIVRTNTKNYYVFEIEITCVFELENELW